MIKAGITGIHRLCTPGGIEILGSREHYQVRQLPPL